MGSALVSDFSFPTNNECKDFETIPGYSPVLLCVSLTVVETHCKKKIPMTPLGSSAIDCDMYYPTPCCCCVVMHMCK